MSKPDKDSSPYVQAYGLHRVWMRAFDAKDAADERARVMARVMNDGKELKGAADYEIRELHRLAFMLEAMNQGWEVFGPSMSDPEFAKDWRADIESGVAHYVVKILASPDATTRLERLADLTKVFPLLKPQPAFAAHYHAPPAFAPTLQHGLKAVMLSVFFELREKMRGTYAGLELPTIGQLDAAVKQRFIAGNRSPDKKPPSDKELREARLALGLSGLPRSNGGRPKKQRGKK
jgi:hypothetical protein